MNDYYRPLVRFDSLRPAHALDVAGGPGWWVEAVHHRRDSADLARVNAADVPLAWQERISAKRPPIAGLEFHQPHLMGILNVTPDSFSDGGQHADATRALKHARQMVEDGATLLDVGGESTRPGAITVPPAAEIARIEPVIRAIRAQLSVPISVDTRKSSVAEAALKCGANLINDVSGFTYDRMLGHFCARSDLPVCIMHALGDPETMQDNPQYDDALLDVYDFLADQIDMLGGLGISLDRIIVDPGIGFGKSLAHNLKILNGLSLYHGLGCPILLGASRKGFIRKITGASPAAARMPGSVATALAGVTQGAQVFRVHDVAETKQALDVWRAISEGEYYDT
ncbi:MAG: dihydropteroate synthase [Pelagimonas sp.]